MRCLGLYPGTHRVDVVERPDPGLPGDGEVLIEVLACGVCGTDRHIIAHGQPRVEPGQSALVLGHEPVGRVLRAGPGVRHLAAGDYVSATNQAELRRVCASCAAGEVDLCQSAAGTGRGIAGMDGFLRPRLLDDAAYCVRVPPQLARVAVLTEPMAVSEKVLAQARLIQRRVRGSPWVERAGEERWAEGLRFLVGGAGPIGMLAALALRARGAEVHVVDLAPAGGLKARLLTGAGATYHCTREHPVQAVADGIGPIDCAVEAAGSGDSCLDLWRSLARNGVLAVIGGSRGGHEPVDAAAVFSQALSKNQAMVGSVASNPRHFELALADLALCASRFPDALSGMITERWDFDHAERAFGPGGDDDVKRVVSLAGA